MAEEEKNEVKGMDLYSCKYNLEVANQKLSQNSETIAVLQKRLIDEMPDRPIFKHHCDECLYLGHVYSRSISIHNDSRRYDLYLHRTETNGIFARYGDGHSEYLVDYEFDSLSERHAYPCHPLLVGLSRAVNVIMSAVMSRVANQPMDNLSEWYKTIDTEEEDDNG